MAADIEVPFRIVVEMPPQGVAMAVQLGSPSCATVPLIGGWRMAAR